MLARSIPGSRVNLAGSVPAPAVRQTSLSGTGPGGRQSAAGIKLARDEVSYTPQGLATSRLLRLWGTLSSLFGSDRSAASGADLTQLRETLALAQRNLETMRQRQGVVDTLKRSVLRQAELVVEQAYGLRGDGAPLRVVFNEDLGTALASVSYQYDRQGRMVDQQLHINMRQFQPDSGPNGTNGHIIENDRIIAHELTHAVMGRNMNMRALPDWFVEGTAEYVAGGAERVKLSLGHMTAPRLAGRVLDRWDGSSDQYAASYLAVRYLESATAANGGLRALMARLKEGDTLDRAVAMVSGGALKDTQAFLTDFVKNAAAFIGSLDLSGRDAGASKPGKGRDVVPDTGLPTGQPLRNFRVIWPSPLEGLSLGAPSNPLGIAPGFAAAAYRRAMPG